MVDIDNDRITIPEDLPSFPQHKELADELREVLTKLQQSPVINSTSSYYVLQFIVVVVVKLMTSYTGTSNVSRGPQWLWQVDPMLWFLNDQ